MKLIFEFLTLILLFILFRGAVRRFLPKKAEMNRFSEESLKALQRFRFRYFRLLIVFILILGGLLYLGLVWLKDQGLFALSDYHLYYPLKDSAMWQPALLGGLLLGSLLAFRVNRNLQSDGLSFYLEELQELVQGYQSFGAFRYFQYGLGLLLFLLLSYSALSSGVGIDKASITKVHPFGTYEKSNFIELKKLDTNKDIQLLLNETDTINLSLYKVNSLELEEFLLPSN